jgi:hypothetical protein
MQMGVASSADVTPKVTAAAVAAFLIRHGSVEVVDLNGNIRHLQPELPDMGDLIVNANRFHFQGKWYTRTAFSRLLG